jgi:hypothetical protein
MYVNAKVLSVETIPEIRGVGVKVNGEGGEFKCDIFDIL